MLLLVLPVYTVIQLPQPRSQSIKDIFFLTVCSCGLQTAEQRALNPRGTPDLVSAGVTEKRQRLFLISEQAKVCLNAQTRSVQHFSVN